jgi:hypothetical protein
MHEQVPYYILIRDKNLKYIRPLITDLEELYDLDQDPEELNNLAIQPAHQSTLLRLRAKAIAELKRTKANIADRLPPGQLAVIAAVFAANGDAVRARAAAALVRPDQLTQAEYALVLPFRDAVE